MVGSNNTRLQPWNSAFKVVLVLGLLCQSLSSQNETLRTVDAKTIDRIVVHGNQIFEIEVYAEKRQTIELRSLLDGEYENNFQISVLEYNNSLEIKLVESKLSEIPDNKRNAHKVVAATLRLMIPIDLRLEVVSDVGFLVTGGRFKSVKANLRSGYFKFIGQASLLHVETARGNIYVSTANTTIEAESAKGKVSGLSATTGRNRAVLKSISGDIIIEKLE